MARGDPPVSPWTYDSQDYLGRVISVSVPWDTGTGNILNGTVVHRDVGCMFHTIVFDNPSDVLLRKPLPSMTDAQTDVTFTWQQVRNATGFRTYADIVAAGQCTAEP